MKHIVHRFLRAVILSLITMLAWAVPAWAVPVTVGTVRVAPYVKHLGFLGQVKSAGRITLSAPMTGLVMGPFVPAGMVRAGVIIARIAPPGLPAQLHAAEAQVRFAHQTLQRDQRLFRSGNLSAATVSSDTNIWKQAVASLRALQAEAASQTLTAPFAGSLDYLIAPGGIVAAGTAIARLSGRGHPWIRVLVPPSTALRLKAGGDATIRGGGWHGQGSITSVGRSARRSGLVSIVVAPSPDDDLLPGEWVSVVLDLPPRTAFVVPLGAVVMHGSAAMVFVDNDGKAREVAVDILGVHGGEVWIDGELHPGDRVVVRGSTRLDARSPLEISP
ncbi:efflux RND transporter periplasmic adaptor subunit [Acidiphilium sp.]|uniref:efflux RND transporter periplasmic adaptor subunit n=1 Tax=Acidiphilium sp. TaxID=527 RepID=UPI003D02E481